MVQGVDSLERGKEQGKKGIKKVNIVSVMNESRNTGCHESIYAGTLTQPRESGMPFCKSDS